MSHRSSLMAEGTVFTYPFSATHRSLAELKHSITQLSLQISLYNLNQSINQLVQNVGIIQPHTHDASPTFEANQEQNNCVASEVEHTTSEMEPEALQGCDDALVNDDAFTVEAKPEQQVVVESDETNSDDDDAKSAATSEQVQCAGSVVPDIVGDDEQLQLTDTLLGTERGYCLIPPPTPQLRFELSYYFDPFLAYVPRQLHTLVPQFGFRRILCPVATNLMHFFNKYGEIRDAFQVFVIMPARTFLSYKCVMLGKLRVLRTGFGASLCSCDGGGKWLPKMDTCWALTRGVVGKLRVRGSWSDEHVGFVVIPNSWAVKAGVECDVYVVHALLIIYLHCSDLVSADKLFVFVGNKNVVCYNAQMTWLLKIGVFLPIIDAFQEMIKSVDETTSSMSVICVVFAYGEYELRDVRKIRVKWLRRERRVFVLGNLIMLEFALLYLLNCCLGWKMKHKTYWCRYSRGGVLGVNDELLDVFGCPFVRSLAQRGWFAIVSGDRCNDVLETLSEEDDIVIDANDTGEPWVQVLMEGEYSDLSVQERLDALFAIIKLANEGNSICVILEEHLEAATALRKHMWAEAQLDNRAEQTLHGTTAEGRQNPFLAVRLASRLIAQASRLTFRLIAHASRLTVRLSAQASRLDVRPKHKQADLLSVEVLYVVFVLFSIFLFVF